MDFTKLISPLMSNPDNPNYSPESWGIPRRITNADFPPGSYVSPAGTQQLPMDMYPQYPPRITDADFARSSYVSPAGTQQLPMDMYPSPQSSYSQKPFFTPVPHNPGVQSEPPPKSRPPKGPSGRQTKGLTRYDNARPPLNLSKMFADFFNPSRKLFKMFADFFNPPQKAVPPKATPTKAAPAAPPPKVTDYPRFDPLGVSYTDYGVGRLKKLDYERKVNKYNAENPPYTEQEKGIWMVMEQKTGLPFTKMMMDPNRLFAKHPGEDKLLDAKVTATMNAPDLTNKQLKEEHAKNMNTTFMENMKLKILQDEASRGNMNALISYLKTQKELAFKAKQAEFDNAAKMIQLKLEEEKLRQGTMVTEKDIYDAQTKMEAAAMAASKPSQYSAEATTVKAPDSTTMYYKMLQQMQDYYLQSGKVIQ